VKSVTTQRILIWWYWVFASLTGIALIILFRVFPPPSSALSADELAAWYRGHLGSMKTGAVLMGWASGWMIQLGVVLWAQARRVEPGSTKIWSTAILVSCSISTVFLALPGLAFGAAAFNAERAPQVTQVMHQLAIFTTVSTDQLYILAWVGVAVVCFISKDSPSNPFPRWWGWVTAWAILVIEPGALAFLPKTGVFAINGVVAFWIPAIAFAMWMVGQTVLLLRALKLQEQEEGTEAEAAQESDLSTAYEGTANR
jgi:hypothetical protein